MFLKILLQTGVPRNGVPTAQLRDSGRCNTKA